MNRLLVTALSFATVLALASSSCSSSGDTPTGDDSGAGPGGTSSQGGTSSHGGKTAAGGATQAGGATSTGGTPGAGGTAAAAGGATSTGGTAPSTGGSTSAGGSPGLGGSSSLGGSMSPGMGGSDAAGGNGAGGDSGGSPGMGGSSTAGTSATGGNGFGGATADLTLAIVPADAILSPPAGVAPVLSYKAILQSGNAPDMDVTSVTTFAVGPAGFGAFNGEVFTAPAGTQGMATVQGTANGLSATTTLTITPPQVILGPGIDPSDPGKFGGGSGAAPMLVYPADGVLVPPNMNSLEFHFIPAAGQTLFSLDFESPNVSLSVYFHCVAVGSGCVFAPDKSFWSILANTARGGSPVTYVLRGVDGTNPGLVGAAPAQTIQFSTEDIVGGLYYWNDSGVIERYDFGLPNLPPQNYLNAAQVGGFACVGCHVMSRDGTRMIAGHDIPEPAAYASLDVATKTVLYKGNPGANFFSFSPDSSQYLASGGANITLHDSTNGSAIGGPLIASGTMPDWSPDGGTIAYARSTDGSGCFGGICAPGVASAALEVTSWDGTSVGAPHEIVPFTGQNNYYPAISPDGNWVIFNRSPGNQDSFSNAGIQTDMNTGMITSYPDGQLWIVNILGGPAIELSHATAGSDSWPKWAPNVNTYQGGKVVWATFSSWRPYGLRLNQWDKTQLWMVAIDLDKLAAGQDASFPAFWVPFQNIKTGNHIGQWVTKVQRQPCSGTMTQCQAGEVCELGRCIPL